MWFPVAVSCRGLLVSAGVCLVLALACQVAAAQAWQPVTPEELAMTEPKVEKGADAEAIFWETRLDDRKLSRLTVSHYVRLKIFTERGREKFSKVEIPFMKGKTVEDVAARVIRPDGSIVNLAPSDIFEQELIRAGKARVMAKSFAVPGIAPGVIVEYQYTETIKDDSVGGERLIFQREIPMHRVTYRVRPYRNSTLRFDWYNLPETDFSDDPQNKDYKIATLTNVPAFKEEPFMPPADEVKKWAYVTYGMGGFFSGWGFFGSSVGSGFVQNTKPTKDIERMAAELTKGLATREEKVEKLFWFARREIVNVSFDRGITEDERNRYSSKNVTQTLKLKRGNWFDVNLLFASLVRSIGLETAFVLAADRSEIFFHPDKYRSRGFLEPAGIAVRIDNRWKFFNPGVPFLKPGQLPWQNESVAALMTGENGYAWRMTTSTDAKNSVARRQGRFTLSSNGDLAGRARIEYEGHPAATRRREEYRETDTKREESFIADLRLRVPNAEVTNLRIENFDDASKPLVYSFDLRVPGYAQRTGRRLLFKPGVFESGSSALFTSEERKTDISFPYPLSYADDIEIVYPEGFAAENPEVPAGIADTKRTATHSIRATINKETRTLGYKRDFMFGSGGETVFPVASYPAIKELFSRFNQADSWMISLSEAR